MFTVVGTEVNGELGSAGAPRRKRGGLALLAAGALSLPGTERRLLKRLSALFVHPFLHRRCCLSVFHETFKWLESLEDGKVVSWKKTVKGEFGQAISMLPLAEACARWPVSTRVSTTDATPTFGGATECWCSRRMSEALYRTSEQKGCRTRLAGWEPEDGELLPAFPVIDELVSTATHYVTRSKACERVRHINLQEIDEVIRESRSSVTPAMLGARLLNATDSSVTLGAWAKGRSGSPGVNRQLQRAMSWQCATRNTMNNFKMSTGFIPADDPSRKVALRPTPAREVWMDEVLDPVPPSLITALVARISGEVAVPAFEEWTRCDPRKPRPWRVVFETKKLRNHRMSFGHSFLRAGAWVVRPLLPPARQTGHSDGRRPVKGRQWAVFESEVRARAYGGLYVHMARGANQDMQDLVWNVALLQASSGGKAILSVPWSRKRGRQALACLVPGGKWHLAMAQDDDDDASDSGADDAGPTVSVTVAGPQYGGNNTVSSTDSQSVKPTVANSQYRVNVVINPQNHPNVVIHPQHHSNVSINPQHQFNITNQDHPQHQFNIANQNHYHQPYQQHPLRSRLIITNCQWSLGVPATALTLRDLEVLPRRSGEWTDALLLSCRSGCWGQ